MLATARNLPATFWYLFAGQFINRLATFVLPFLSIYLTEHRGFSVAAAGGVLSLFGVGSIGANFLGGLLADKLGRRTTMLIGLGLGPLFVIALAQAREPALIAALTFGVGLFNDLSRPAMSAAIADVVTAERRSDAYALIYWVVNLGTGIAMLGAGLLADQRFELLFYADAVTTLLYSAIVFMFVPETRPAQVSHKRAANDPMAPFADSTFVLFAIISIGLYVIFSQHFSTLPLAVRAHGLPPATFGMLMALNCFLIIVAQPVVAAAAGRTDRGRMLALGGLLFGIGFGATAFATTTIEYGACVVIWTLGEMLLLPTAHSVVADLAPEHLRGGYQGSYGMTWSVASILGPSVGGVVVGTLGYQSLWIGCLGLGVMAALGHWLGFAPRYRARMVRRAG